jgi:hypothetical protein
VCIDIQIGGDGVDGVAYRYELLTMTYRPLTRLSGERAHHRG